MTFEQRLRRAVVALGLNRHDLRCEGLDGVTQIAGGSKHMLALKSDGTVWVWGANKYAQLGLGDTEARVVPTRIPSLAGVTRIHASTEMSAARQADGSWVVWGLAPSAQPPTDDGPPVRTPSPLPGLLRDASDVADGAVAFRDGSVRTWGTNSFARIPSGVIGTSPGAIGTAVAQQQLRSVLSFCNSPQMNAPEAYIQFKPGLITETGEVTDESTAEFLRNFMSEFHQFVVRVRTVIPRVA